MHCLGASGRAEYVLSSRPARRIHPIFWARRYIVPRACLVSTLLDTLSHLGHERGSPDEIYALPFKEGEPIRRKYTFGTSHGYTGRAGRTSC